MKIIAMLAVAVFVLLSAVPLEAANKKERRECKYGAKNNYVDKSDSGIEFYQKLVINYCNIGSYEVDELRLKITDEDGNVLHERTVTPTLYIGDHYVFKLDGLADMIEDGVNPHYIKVRLKIYIGWGDTEKCTKVFDPTNDLTIWSVFTKGTTVNKNRCRNAAVLILTER